MASAAFARLKYRLRALLGSEAACAELECMTDRLAVQYLADQFRGWSSTPPKTRKAKRTIPPGAKAIAALEPHRQPATRTAPRDLAFATRTGKPMRESKVLTEVLQSAAVEAGLGA